MTDPALPGVRDDHALPDLIHLIYASAADPGLERVWVARLEARLDGRVRLHEPDRPRTDLQQIFAALSDGRGDAEAAQVGHPSGVFWAARRELSSAGFADAIALQVRAGGEIRTILSLHRRPAAPALDAQQGVMLNRLAPHLVLAADLRARLGRAADAGLAVAAALDVEQTGLLVVDASRRIQLESELVGSAYRSGVVSRSGDAFEAADEKAGGLLRQAVAAATRPSCPRPSSFSLQGEGGRYKVIVAPFPGGVGEARAGRALVLLSRSRAVTREDLQREYGVTPSEAALLCGLVNGQRLAEYAKSAGLQMSTVKTHLRGVFMKTGEQRQADVIRRVLTDMLAGEPGACS